MKRFRGGLVFKAHRLVYRSILGSRVIKKTKKGHEWKVGTATFRFRGTKLVCLPRWLDFWRVLVDGSDRKGWEIETGIREQPVHRNVQRF